MRLNEVLPILRMSREQVRVAILEGIELPKSHRVIHLEAKCFGDEFDISEENLDKFIDLFHAEEPGRHPPVKIARALLVEANHRCAICREALPLQFHHIIEYSSIGHYDVRHMLAVCGSCHDLINVGRIDVIAQKQYKEKISKNSHYSEDTITRFSWYDLREVIQLVHDTLYIAHPTSESKYDFSLVELEEKNKLNFLGKDYFEMMLCHHEPYFGKINEFLRSPTNKEAADLYYEIVDEFRSKIATRQNIYSAFENVLIEIYDSARDAYPDRLRLKSSTLNILLSFMYFNCDIGRKK